jgi:hypothetical protein
MGESVLVPVLVLPQQIPHPAPELVVLPTPEDQDQVRPPAPFDHEGTVPLANRAEPLSLEYGERGPEEVLDCVEGGCEKIAVDGGLPREDDSAIARGGNAIGS